nr:receptor-type tyrosine-protein phosphatase gamma-like [Odocoileus virginianus texanus]
MRRLLEPCWWILFLKITSSVLHYVVCFPALTEGYVGTLHSRQGSSAQAQIRRRKASGDPYWAYSGAYGPEHWVTSSVSCGGRQQSPIDISDQHARVSEEYQDLQLDGFDNESSNKTWMKNTGKTVAILLKDDYFVSGAGLPGRFKAEKVEFHWGHSNGSAGSEHSVNSRRFPVELPRPSTSGWILSLCPTRFWTCSLRVNCCKTNLVCFAASQEFFEVICNDFVHIQKLNLSVFSWLKSWTQPCRSCT